MRCAPRQVSKSKKYLGKLYHKSDVQRFGGSGGMGGEEEDDFGPMMPPEPSPPGLSAMHYQL